MAKYNFSKIGGNFRDAITLTLPLPHPPFWLYSYTNHAIHAMILHATRLIWMIDVWALESWRLTCNDGRLSPGA